MGDALGNTHTLVAKQAQEHWVKDEEVSHCSNAECHVKFGLLDRRHHCRRCGLIFCSRHSNRTAAVPLAGYYKKVRVCEGCFQNLFAGELENERRRSQSNLAPQPEKLNSSKPSLSVATTVPEEEEEPEEEEADEKRMEAEVSTNKGVQSTAMPFSRLRRESIQTSFSQ